MLDKLPSTKKNIELLGSLYRKIMDVSKNPQAAAELVKDPEVAQIEGLAEKITQADGDSKALTILAESLDIKSKQLFERPKATHPATPQTPTKTKDAPVKDSKEAGVVYHDQYGAVVDSEIPKESKQ